MRNEQLVAKVWNYAHVLRDQRKAFIGRFVTLDLANDPVNALLARIRVGHADPSDKAQDRRKERA